MWEKVLRLLLIKVIILLKFYNQNILKVLKVVKLIM